MQPDSYLQKLTTRLSNGIAALPEAQRKRQASFLQSLQNEDGGFSGREGESDLYYTGFALRALAILDALEPGTALKAGAYIQQRMVQEATVVDFYSLLYAALLIQVVSGHDVLGNSPDDWPDRVAATLETFRTAEGGYAKTPGAASTSTYHTFLVGLCYELLGRSLPQPIEVVAFVQARQREDGGFVEIKPMRRSGTNPTAAAIGLLQLVEDSTGTVGLTPEIQKQSTAFLAEMPSMEGGLRANGRAPAADLLSTFTGLWTLDQLGGLDQVSTTEARRYVESLELAEGGFRGGLWDDGTDVEYTFYGLGALSLLSHPD